MFTLRHNLEMLFFIIAATAVSLFILQQRNYRTNQNVFSQVIPVFPTVEPTPTPPSPVETINFDSSDGTKTLTMKKQKTVDFTSYSFFTLAKSDISQKLIFSKKESPAQELSIPFNSWSPNNAYFFLKETTPALSNYYVFHTSGDTFANNSQYINIQDFFLQKISEYTLDDVTGWADPNLLIVNTKTAQQEPGPSFWFDMPSQTFIQLSTRFN